MSPLSSSFSSPPSSLSSSLRRVPAHLCRTCRSSSRPSGPCSRPRFYARPYATRPASPKGSDIYDVVCIGGGPAGLSLLAALRSNPLTSHLRTALVEAQPFAGSLPRDPSPTSTSESSFSNRCSSLTPASAEFLRSIGAWPHLLQTRVQPYGEMRVWDGVSGASIGFDAASTLEHSPADDPIIAYMVENVNLTSALLSRLLELGGVDLFDGTRVEGIGLGGGEEGQDVQHHAGPDLREWPVVHLAGRSLWARLLVGADGANSPVRTFAGIASRGWDYNRHGVVATLSHDAEPDRKVAYQRFLPTGTVALLPLPGRTSTLVWTTTTDRAALLKSLSPPDFVAMVNAAFRLSPVDLAFMHTITSGQGAELAWRMPHTTPASSSSDPEENPALLPPAISSVQPNSVASFPLRLRHADSYISHRVALVGDAAHTIHPLAGQGLNQGQADVRSLARVVARAAECGLDIGARMSLEPYGRDRYADNHVLAAVCDKLHRLYSVGSGPLVWARSMGMEAVDRWGSLKGWLMRRAAGGTEKPLIG